MILTQASTAEEWNQTGEGTFYKLPKIYEVAFSYRHIGQECDFLTGVYHACTGNEPHSVLELACGPGEHVREFRQRGCRVAALDISAEMTAYLAAQLGSDDQTELLTADMAKFALRQPVDLAFTLIDSLPYLTTNEQIVSHFRCVRQALHDGGVYVVELRHPGDVWFGNRAARSTLDRWTMEQGDLKVTTEWGVVAEANPVAQTERVLARVTVEQGDRREVIESWEVLRPLLPQELLALVDIAGGWRFAGWWGEFDLARTLGQDPRDWRMIVAFQKQ